MSAEEQEVPMFDGHYNDWREKRVGFILKIYEKTFFEGKKILELGCGHGHVGLFFEEIGSDVLFLDARKEHIEVVQNKTKAKTIIIDQNKPWYLGKFDILIHWGVLYHLDDWRSDLECCSRQSDLIFLESEVCDSDEDFEVKVPAIKGYDQDLGRFSTRPSAKAVENHLTKLGLNFERFDSPDLNSGFHIYDWKVKNSKTWKNGMRRFWICSKKYSYN